VNYFYIVQAQYSHLVYVQSIAVNGNSAHLIKVGSKRRRTQAELKEQYEMDQLIEVEQQESEQKAKTQVEQIKEL